MKKTLTVVAVVLVALVIFGAGVVFSQYQLASAAGYGPGMMGDRGGMMGGRGGNGVMHNYVEQALADKLGMTEAQVEEQFSAGKSMYQIALDKGTAEADVAAFLTEVHKTAFTKAVADGVMTQARADLMLKNMTDRGFDPANCPMGGQGAADGTGFRGGMMGGRQGRGIQQVP